MKQRYYHGGAQVYDELLPGDGIDGKGIYLTSDKRRAMMYGARDTSGAERKSHITEVLVEDRVKVWEDEGLYDLRNFTKASWLTELIQKYGEQGAIMSGQNARVYLGWTPDQDPGNRNLKRLGYQAIHRGSDFIVLDPSIITYEKKRARPEFRDIGHVGGHWGHAGSGMLFTTGPKILLLLRSHWVMEPGTWGIPGGAIPVDPSGKHMAPLASAKREVAEEVGRVPKYEIVEKYVYTSGDPHATRAFTFTTFVSKVDHEFTPTLNDESDDFKWWDPEHGPKLPLHYGVKALLRHWGIR